MIFRKILFSTAVVMLAVQPSYADTKRPQVESDQQISDFSLAGYGDKGKKSWDLSGKSADIFDEVVKLKEVVGNLYGQEDDIKLTAEKGDFNKKDGKVHLEQDVVITTSSGTRMTTDSLDWDRKNELVTTVDPVNIQRDNMAIVAQGAKGETNFKRIALEKNVRLDINPQEEQGNKGREAVEKIIITCDGPLVVDYDKNIAAFNNNVKVDRADTVIYSDKMDVYFTVSSDEEKKAQEEVAGDKSKEMMNSKIERIVARGNVRVARGENVSYSDEAIYTAAEKKLVLTGRPRLVITSTENMGDASFGN